MTAFVGFPQDGHSFSANEVGLALAGLVTREVSGVPRVGMLGIGPTVSAVGASWQVQVNQFVYVHQVLGAIQLSGLSAPEQVDILPAAGDISVGQARIDVICWNPVDAELSVVQGTPAISPVVPSVAPLVAIARVRVNAADGIVISGQISTVYQLADRVTGSLTSVTSGYSVGVATRIERDSSGMVDAYVEVTAGSGQLTSALTVAFMPEGFRPKADVEFAAGQSTGGNAGAVFTQILPSGAIRAWNPTLGNKKLSFHVRYRAA